MYASLVLLPTGVLDPQTLLTHEYLEGSADKNPPRKWNSFSVLRSLPRCRDQALLSKVDVGLLIEKQNINKFERNPVQKHGYTMFSSIKFQDKQDELYCGNSSA